MFVGRINLGVALLFTGQKTDFFESLQLALDIARVLFDELGKPAYVSVKIRVFGVDNYDFAPHP